MKKILLIALSAFFVLTAFYSMDCFTDTLVIEAEAAHIVKSGKCGENLSWKLNSDGVMTISGTGAMWDFRNDASGYDYHPCPWKNLKSKIKKVVFNDGITYIGADAFHECVNLKKVVFSDTITTIGSFAFRLCVNLENFTLPKNLGTLGQQAFDGCEKITAVTIPASVSFWDGQVFANCSSLKDVYIDGNKSNLGFSVRCNSNYFDFCYALEKIEVSPEHPFFCSINGVLFDKEKTEVLVYPAGKKDKEYVVPSTVKTISRYSFEYNEHIEKVVLPYGLENIGLAAFEKCTKLQEIIIPDSVKHIGEHAFMDCESIENIKLSNSLESIEEYTFYGCRKLKSFTIPASVKEIGRWAFAHCSSLEKFTVDKNNACYTSVNGVLFNKEKTELVAYPAAKSNKTYAVPATVSKIRDAAFIDAKNLTSITISGPVKKINIHTFDSCESLESIIVPASVTGIGNYAFSNCPKLSNVYYEGTKEQWKGIKKGSNNSWLTNAKKYYNYLDHKYTFSLSATSYTFDGYVKTPTVTVKDKAGKVLKKGTDYTVTYAEGRKDAGTYNVTVKMIGNYTGAKTLTFKINPINISTCTVKLSNTSYTYNGKVKTPTVSVINSYGTKLKAKNYTVTYQSGRKNVGTYKVTIKMIGNYTGTKTLTFKINPPKTTVASLTAGTKSITVNLTKKTTQTTGYQIQYSTNKDFTNAKTKLITSNSTVKATLTGLTANKTYYVRVRTYKTVNDVKYYSGWSAYKYVKTR